MKAKNAIKAAKKSVKLSIKAIEAAGFMAETVRRCKSEARASGEKRARELDLNQYEKAQKRRRAGREEQIQD